MRRRRRGGLLVLAAALVVENASAAADAGDDAGDGGAFTVLVEREVDRIRAFLAGELAVAVDPRALFDVALEDEAAVRVESVRLRTLLRTVDESTRGTAVRRGAVAPSPASLAAVRADIDALDGGPWNGRIDLDRARLEVYSLPRERREEPARLHATRREAARPEESAQERAARTAEEEQRRALEAARVARSEAERLVGEEVARLIGVEQAIEAARKRFRDAREELAVRQDVLLGWQRRARDAKAAGGADVDGTYDALRRSLRASRDDLEGALNALQSATSTVPPRGAGPLDDVPPEVPADAARERRAHVDALAREALREGFALREERAAALLDESAALNRERLGLLPYLSADKRRAITGFTAVAFEQARAEARHLRLILRYHLHVGLGWLRSWSPDREGMGRIPVWQVVKVAVPWILLALAFAWWRRRSAALLTFVDARLAEAGRGRHRALAAARRTSLQLIAGVRRPLERLVFIAVAVWLLPPGARDLLEVQLLVVIVGWLLGGALIVNVINAVAALAAAKTPGPASDVGALRLRSLRLVGWVVVAFALALVLTARLVGEGTVYRWVSVACWLAVAPVFLLLVRWWRGTVFERLAARPRKSPLQVWILANQRGWKSFLAATGGLAHLVNGGLRKLVRRWLTRFDLVRRAHAYLFKRELDRLSTGAPTVAARPLSAEVFASLGPDRQGEDWIPSPADTALAILRRRIERGRGGLVAIVGERGSGKSSVLERMAVEGGPAPLLACRPETSLAEVIAALASAGEAAPAPGPKVVRLDDVHELVKPVLGGLAAFDALMTLLRAESATTLWVLALDSVVWPFLRRSRDSRPLFDDVIVLAPWTDDTIGELLLRRCAEAGVVPVFDDLLEVPPTTAEDDLDRQEALAENQAGYFRMLWDYARGNPGMALEVWRTSLVQGVEGTVRARPLQAPDASSLEALPDAGLFILRAVLQLAPATVADVAQATRLSEGEVRNAFHVGQARGYLVEEGGRYLVGWSWLRAIVVLLERRHLLVSP